MESEFVIDVDELEFVSPCPDYLHLKCPICMDVLTKEPHLVTCCGNHFCGDCVKALGSFKPCPLCKATSFNRVTDKGHYRILNSLQVCCLHKAGGCKWEGPLGKVTAHVSRKDGDCGYVSISCRYQCGQEILRSSLEHHEGAECPKRPSHCGHCAQYKGNWTDVEEHKKTTCPCVPITCGCGEEVRRKDVEQHLVQCPDKTIQCNYAYAGCQWLGKRTSLDEHLDNNMDKHLSLVSSHTDKTITRQAKRIDNQQSMIEEQALMLAEQQDTIEEMERRLDNQEQLMSELLEEMITLKASMTVANLPAPSKQSYRESPVSPPREKPPPVFPTMKFVIDRFKHKKANHNLHHSPEFAHGGMIIQATVWPNGVGCGKGSHVSLSVKIVRGALDGVFIVRLHAQSIYNRDYRQELKFNYSTKKVDIELFIPHSHLDLITSIVTRDELVLEFPQVHA